MATGVGHTVPEGGDAVASSPRPKMMRQPVTALLLLLALAAGLFLLPGPAVLPASTAPAALFSTYPWAYLRDGQPVAAGESVVDLMAVGDVMPGRGVAAAGGTWTGVGAWLGAADLTMGNLEAVLLAQEPAAAEGGAGRIVLSGSAGAAADLRAAGFDLVSVANNHGLDWGPAGLAESVAHLERAGLEVIGLETAAGSSNVVIREVNGVRLAFLAFNAVPAFGPVPVCAAGSQCEPRPAGWEPAAAAKAIAAARRQADAVIVSIHWGFEYEPRPDPRQEEMARLMVDAGADLVLGHHPHVAQPLAVVGDGFVAYSVGNFLFDQGENGTHDGLALRAFFDEAGLRAVQLLPVRAGGAPRLQRLDEAAALLERVMPPPPRIGFSCDGTSCTAEPVPASNGSGTFYAGAIDLTGDGEPEIIRRAAGQIAIYERGEEVWRTPQSWRIDDVALGDPNNDGRYELMLAIHRPDPSGIARSQPYVIGYRGGRYDLLWGGRPVADPIRELVVGDVDGEGLQELVVIEEMTDGSGVRVSVWRWSGWAFTLLWRGEPGCYRDLLFRAGEQPPLSVTVACVKREVTPAVP